MRAGCPSDCDQIRPAFNIVLSFQIHIKMNIKGGKCRSQNSIKFQN